MALISKLSRVYFTAVVAAVLFSCMKMGGATWVKPSVITAEQMYGEIAGSSIQAKPNFVFSPFSIFSVFHAAQRGAAGETKAQMDALVGPNESFTLPELRQPRRNEGSVAVDVANQLYVHPELEKNRKFLEFKQLLAQEGHSAETLNFAESVAAAEKINSLVAHITHDHIKNLINASALGESTRLVLVNALYFKAPWLQEFPESATKTAVFTTPSGPKDCKFMRGKLDKSPLLYNLREDVVSVGLPYADPRLRMYVFMPKDLASFESQMVANPEFIEDIVADMELVATERAYEEEVYLTLPKFKLSADDNKIDLADLFQRLGASDMFDTMKADFSGISGNRDLAVSSFVHQADIDVNEEGTEATAATAMVINLRSMPLPKTPVDIEINKPFMFQLRFIFGETDFILFSGRVADPTAAQ